MKTYRKISLVQAYQHQGEPIEIYTGFTNQTVRPGDWIIINPNGERYPCPDKVFKETYEEVLEDN